jgi:hypothetical protein
VLASGNLNLNVWDFAIDPAAPENAEAQRPQPRRPIELHRRP